MITATATVGGSIGVVAQLMSIQTTVCAAVTEQVNDVTVGTTPSGGVNNQLNQDTAGNQVGTGANPSVVANSTAVNSDGSYSLSILAEGSNVISDTPILANGSLIINQPSTIAKDVVVRYVNGTLVGSVVGSEIEIPNPVVVPTLTIGVFNSLGDPVTTADVGEVLTIELTTSIVAPTEYRFFIFEGSLQGVATIQAGNTITFTVNSPLYVMIYAEAKDATSVTASLNVFEVSINGDVSANTYIAKHNDLSGLTMAAAQQAVVHTTYQMLKGNGTTYGSNLHAKLVACNGEVYAFTPVSSAVVSLATIAIDWIETAIPCTIVGFTLADVANNGVTGASGKYLILKRSPSNFGQNDGGVHAFSRTALTGTFSIAIGATTFGISSSGSLLNISTDQTYSFLNTSATNHYASSGLGMFSVIRNNAANLQLYDDGVLIASQTRASLTPTTNKFYAFAHNDNGTPIRPFLGKLPLVSDTCAFTGQELIDWNEIWAYYTTNMNN